jgi:DNA-binding MarR family transcriptional regulator
VTSLPPDEIAGIPAAPDAGSPARAIQMHQLLTMRMVELFTSMRRSTILNQRRLFQLSEIEWRIMTQVGRGEPLSLNGLAERLVRDRGQLSRTVKGMVARGLLTRNRKPGMPDIEIGLAPQGQALRAKMVELAFQRDSFLTVGLDPADVEVARRVIDLMAIQADILLDKATQAKAADHGAEPLAEAVG